MIKIKKGPEIQNIHVKIPQNYKYQKTNLKIENYMWKNSKMTIIKKKNLKFENYTSKYLRITKII